MNKFFLSDNYNYLSHKKISVMAAVRSNLGAIENMIENIFQTSLNPDNIEVLVRMDDDDPDGISLSQSSIFHKYNVKLYIGFRHGYTAMHKYYNELAPVSVGDIMFFWGDDISMITSGWDVVLHKHIGEIEILQNMIYYNSDDGLIEASNHYYSPVITRPLFDIIGSFAPGIVADSYYLLIGEMVGIMSRVDVGVLMMAEEHNDDELVAWGEFNSEENQKKITEDVMRISGYLDNNGIPRRKYPYFLIGFHPTPKIELRGGPSAVKYFIEFIDKRTNGVVFSISLPNYNWASCPVRDMVPWLIRVTSENGEVLLEYNFDLSGKKVIIEMGGNNTEELLRWVSCVEKFRDKYNCEVFCLTVYPELFNGSYDGIKFGKIESRWRDNTEIYASYRIESGMEMAQIVNRLGLNE